MPEPKSRTPPKSLRLDDLRAYAVARSLFTPTTLPRALARMGFVQADPIRAPARAQDLTLRHRVKGYRDGDLERRYPRLPIEEDALHNYGFVTRAVQALMHPRTFSKKTRIERSHPELIEPIVEFVRANGPTHPRELDPHHGGRSVTNYWGGSSAAATHMLDTLHYRGTLRVVRRERGIRVYSVATHHAPADEGPGPHERVGRLIAQLVSLYAPIPASSLRQLTMMLRYGAPGLAPLLSDRGVVGRALDAGYIAQVAVDDRAWYVPPGERIGAGPRAEVRLLAPFDPVVWDRRRFELFWNWRYRFEAYTPPAQRVLGYYALPLLYGDDVIGWANARSSDDRLHVELGFVGKRPRDAIFKRELDGELARLAAFLGVAHIARLSFLR
jgi:uncharacterized protein YcaQ